MNKAYYIVNIFLIPFLFLIYSCNKTQFREASNGQLYKKGVITKKQSELIFTRSKVFPNKTQVSIAIIKNGIATFYGIKREKDSIITFDNQNSVFEIGSISKVFTSTLLANFVIDSKLKLDCKINNYIKTSIRNNIQISFKELANHTSGLPRLPSNLTIALFRDSENPYKKYNEDKIKEYLSERLKLKQKPGIKYQYSNLGVGILGYSLSKMENTSYQELLQNKIFLKYGMTNSTTNRNDISDLLVKGLNQEGKEVSNWDLASLVSAGGILSTVNDLSKFAVAQFDSSNKELNLTRVKTFSAKGDRDIGLGWFIKKKEKGNYWYWHTGGMGGYRSFIIIDTMNKNGVIVLSNVSTFNKEKSNIDELCLELMETLS